MTRFRGVLLLVAVQLPLIALFTFLFVVAKRGDDGVLDSVFLRESIYPTARRMEGAYTDLKFRARGSEPVKHKIVIVEIDDEAVSKFQRWPWHRDAIAGLVYNILDAGAKVVGLDIVFPEPDVRVSDPVVELLKANNLDARIPDFETDNALLRIITVFKDRIALGWMTDHWCRPAYDTHCDPTIEVGEDFAKFRFDHATMPRAFDAADTRLISTGDVTGNLPAYEVAARNAGFLVAGAEDSDGVVRRAILTMLVGGKPYPSLPLEMARVGQNEELTFALDADGLVERIGFAKSKRWLDVTPGGAYALNFRGPGYHFEYVGAYDVLLDDPEIPVQHDGTIVKKPRAEIFKDAYVLIGVTAIGARDLRHFPFGDNIPGTEGLATVLDNVLANDGVDTETPTLAIVIVMVIGGALYGLLMLRLSALPALVVSLVLIGGLAALDVLYVFGRLGRDLPTVFFLVELAALFVVTVAVKYVLEERGKRFIRGAFSKYLAPTVVDQMLKDPAKLALGGETRKLTIMMSDLRGFTAMAERMKPHEVLAVLNHYLGTMADIIMEYGGTIDEFIGDAILVIFGAPIPGQDDARRAVACAVAMQRAMIAINEHNAKQGLPKLEMGIALNTGEVIVGNIGSQKHIKYGVVGSHVNLTARIESNTVGGQVLISGTTLELAGDQIAVGEKQSIVAKGFPEPIPAFEIKGIGGEYALTVPEIDLELRALAAPLAVTFRVMKGKNEEGEERRATLTSISKFGATLALAAGDDHALEAYANLKLRVTAADGATLVDGDLYAKVTVAGDAATLRFTAVPPAVAARIAEL